MWQRRRREQQKVLEVRRLAAGLGHDINNLLMVVLAATDVVRDRAATADELARAATDIEDAALRSAAIARQLLAIGNARHARGSGPIPPGELAPVHAAEELRRLESTLCRAVGPSVRVAMTITSELPTIVDGGQLGQAVLNLAVNARDAMPGGGAIRIEARDVVIDQMRTSADGAALPGRYVAISVEDTGVGMDLETQARAREPFFTTKRGSGSGLGLAMVDDIVRRHGGFVDIRSRRDHGTTVTMYLPACAARAS